jgi:hypothetical protein
MAVGSTEAITGVGSTEPDRSVGDGFAVTGAEAERKCRLCRRWSGV